MTFLDKYMQEHPGANVISDAHGIGCPYHHNYEKNYDCSGVTCTDCWQREIPEDIDNIENELIEKALSDEKPGAWVDEIFKPVRNYYTDGTEKIRGMRHNGDDIDETPVLTDDIKEVFDTPCNSIKDSGDRTQFATGAVRDMHEGKGRCDLLPLELVSKIYEYLIGEGEASWIFYHLSEFQNNGFVTDLVRVLDKFHGFDDSLETMFLEVAKHFEDGAKKYGEYNWQKGIPVNCYIDSAVRHYLKYLRGDEDERHDRAFVWNILCCIWTCKHKPELNTYKRSEDVCEAGVDLKRDEEDE